MSEPSYAILLVIQFLGNVPGDWLRNGVQPENSTDGTVLPRSYLAYAYGG
jgi:hypothetical protein